MSAELGAVRALEAGAVVGVVVVVVVVVDEGAGSGCA
jgi:hypothetical protein